MTSKTPKFLRVLYDILHTEAHAILTWSPCGAFFQVYDITRLEQDVLPRYFKHSKFASFQRQLNNFGFRKWTKTRTSVCTFSHDTLVRCTPSELSEMVTKSGIVSPHTKIVGAPGKRSRSDSETTESGSECDVLTHYDPKKFKASDDQEEETDGEQSLQALLNSALNSDDEFCFFESLEISSDDWLLSDAQDELIDIFDELFCAASTIDTDEWLPCSV